MREIKKEREPSTFPTGPLPPSAPSASSLLPRSASPSYSASSSLLLGFAAPSASTFSSSSPFGPLLSPKLCLPSLDLLLLHPPQIRLLLQPPGPFLLPRSTSPLLLFHPFGLPLPPSSASPPSASSSSSPLSLPLPPKIRLPILLDLLLILKIIVRQLKIYTTAILLSTLQHLISPREDKWCTIMEEISKTSCSHYYNIIYHNPDFIPTGHPSGRALLYQHWVSPNPLQGVTQAPASHTAIESVVTA